MFRSRWLIVAITLLAMSAAAVLAGAKGYPEFVPQIVVRTLDQFLEPGLALWWLTLGGPFQSFPARWAGYCVTIFGNALLWLALVSLIVFLTGVARRLLFRRQRGALATIAEPSARTSRDQ
jgi:hypothetical protein